MESLRHACAVKNAGCQNIGRLFGVQEKTEKWFWTFFECARWYSHDESLKQSCKNNLCESRMVVGCRHWVWHRENSSRCLIMHFHLLTLKLHANWVFSIMHLTLSVLWQGGVTNAFWWRVTAHIQRWSPKKMEANQLKFVIKKVPFQNVHNKFQKRGFPNHWHKHKGEKR